MPDVEPVETNVNSGSLESPRDDVGETPVEYLDQDDEPSSNTEMSAKNVHRLLYASHALSAWNSRAFEFGAFLFLATIYPQTLLPASVYALMRAGSTAVLSSWIGRYIDNCERLSVVRHSIIGQRLAVIASCAILLLLVRFESLRNNELLSYSSMAALSLLACVEKLSAVMNTISVERDWVVCIAEAHEERLKTINSQMRRIDLFCKLMAPLCISFIDSASPLVAIGVTAGMTVLSFPIEYFAIARVYRTTKMLAERSSMLTTADQQPRVRSNGWRNSVNGTLSYFKHPAFLPSFALALLYLTVLSFSGQMITYLLAIGLQSSVIGALRGVAAIFELSATWIAPQIMQRIGPIRSGIWFINWQSFCVATACFFFWFDSDPTVTVIGTIGAVIASRIGLWGFDLSVQIIIQEEVEADMRGTFSSQEFAFQNVFEMLSFASTILFARPTQFKVPATISAFAVGLAGVLYAAFVRTRRGHLVHLSNCLEKSSKGRARGWQSIPRDEEGLDEPTLPMLPDTRA